MQPAGIWLVRRFRRPARRQSKGDEQAHPSMVSLRRPGECGGRVSLICARGDAFDAMSCRAAHGSTCSSGHGHPAAAVRPFAGGHACRLKVRGGRLVISTAGGQRIGKSAAARVVVPVVPSSSQSFRACCSKYPNPVK